jgi:hypothetical protein
MLSAKGCIVVSDVIPPDYSSRLDFVDLLRFCARRRILGRAIWQLLGELWRYWQVRNACSLTRLSNEDLSRLGKNAGLAVNFSPANLTHFTKRSTAIFTPVLESSV